MQEPKITAATLARTAVLALALTNQLLSAAGKPVLPIESAALEQAVTAGLTVAASLWSWWKNNAFTPEARQAEAYLTRLRDQRMQTPSAAFLFLGYSQTNKNGSAEAEP